jgi:tetratricopeptide (TPR) repeat protein
MRRRTTVVLVGGAVAAALALGGLFGGVLGEHHPAGPSVAAAPRVELETTLSGFVRGRGTAATVATLETELRAHPHDADRLASLGLAYQLRWRETGDPTFLPLSERALSRALARRPRDASVTLGLGNLALIRHDFRRALRLGHAARRLAPAAARPYGVVGDALLELGRYDEAFAAFDRMTALKPTLASYARVAYARELTGDRAGAVSAMLLALDAAAGIPEPTAWTHVELAKLALGSGRVERAARHVRAALAVFPGYVPALEQRARVEAARGELGRATETARRAATAVPLPQLVALHADLLDRLGRTAAARGQRRLVAAIERLLRANGLRVDLEAAVLRADHRIEPRRTVALARRARADRPSIHGDDALGWALARAGSCDEAGRWLDRALRLGTRDALLFFHRGYAAGCAGDRAEMRAWYRRALRLDPSFSVRWAPVAARLATTNRSLAGREGPA